MNEYIYSPAQNMICACALKNDYQLAGTWPVDALMLDESTALEFMGEAPEDKVMGAGLDGLPVWNDIPPLTPSQLTEKAEQYRGHLLDEAQDIISLWQTKLLLGRISNDEKGNLNAWLDYIDAVQAVDTSTARNINWPVPPQTN